VQGLPSSVTDAKCSIFTNAKTEAQTLSLSVLVTMEMLKALSAVSLDNSLIRVPTWKNPWLLGGVALPFSIHLAVLYTPLMNKVFGVCPLTQDDWVTVLKWAGPIVLLDEVLKAIGRYLKSRETKERMAEVQMKLTAAPVTIAPPSPPLPPGPPK
jgi:Ca2+-transporting ATPase